MVNDQGLRLSHIFSVEQGRWIARSEIQKYEYEDVREEIAIALGNDFFAEIDSSFLVALLMAWLKANKEDEGHRRNLFLCQFNLALDRAIKRKQIKAL